MVMSSTSSSNNASVSISAEVGFKVSENEIDSFSSAILTKEEFKSISELRKAFSLLVSEFVNVANLSDSERARSSIWS